MKLFDLDSPLMRFLSRISELMIVNVLTIICCLPIITIGPALAAAHYTLLKMARDEYSYVAKTYFKGFKDNLKQGIQVTLLLILVVVVLWYDYFLVTESGFPFGNAIRIALIVVMVIVGMTAIYVFPVMAKFANTLGATIRNAAIMSVLQIHKTVLMAILYIIPVYVFAFMPKMFPILLMLGISVPMYLSVKLYNKFFLKIEANVWAEQQMSEETTEKEAVEDDDSEKIFSDNLNEALLYEEQGITPIMSWNRDTEETVPEETAEQQAEETVEECTNEGNA